MQKSYFCSKARNTTLQYQNRKINIIDSKHCDVDKKRVESLNRTSSLIIRLHTSIITFHKKKIRLDKFEAKKTY